MSSIRKSREKVPQCDSADLRLDGTNALGHSETPGSHGRVATPDGRGGGTDGAVNDAQSSMHMQSVGFIACGSGCGGAYSQSVMQGGLDRADEACKADGVYVTAGWG